MRPSPIRMQSGSNGATKLGKNFSPPVHLRNWLTSFSIPAGIRNLSLTPILLLACWPMLMAVEITEDNLRLAVLRLAELTKENNSYSSVAALWP